MCTRGRGHFWPQGYNMNNLGSGPLDEASYQISKTVNDEEEAFE